MSNVTHREEGSEDLTIPVKSQDDREGIQLHLKEILEGDAFRGSNRSGQFLKHIIEETLSGRQENLKERLLGIEIFGRSAAYDTGEDAIVRVTASDVRKRLLQHYGRPGGSSYFRFSLPPGSYVPRITREPVAVVQSLPRPHSATPSAQFALSHKEPTEEATAAIRTQVVSTERRLHLWLVIAAVSLLLNLGLGFGLWHYLRVPSNNPLASLLPWTTVLSGASPPLLITSDPNIAEIQGISGSSISLSDYANHKYVPHPNLLTPAELHFCDVILRGDKASVVDTPVAVDVASIAASKMKSILVRGARTVQLADLQGDKNLIVLGSTRSNPWSSLFYNHLDFRFEFEPGSLNEIIRNVHPRAGEAATYVATAPGWATGESYALIALLQNPDGNGHVLLLGGENGEGTEAANRLLNDAPKLRAALSKCGINSTGPGRNFEMLLHLNTLAGSPSNVDAIACHIM